MKRTLRKLKSAIKSGGRGSRRGNRARARALRDSVARWASSAVDFTSSTIPTTDELRTEFADWKSFDPIPLDEIGSIRFAVV